MKSTRTGAELARFEAVRRRFELWRSKRQGRERIPERLWTAAVKLAATYGLASTARTLRLDYYALKKRVEASGSSDAPAGSMPRQRPPTPNASIAKASTQDPATTFVELTSLEPAGASECTVELEHPRGTKMRIRLTGRQSPEVVAAVSRVFFGAAL
ncbi:MAG: hypothetical protein GY953_15960 [bacterium]|nr:hypothetical protein [bacterium]